MSNRSKKLIIGKKISALLFALLLVVSSFTVFISKANATGQLTSAYVKLSDSTANSHVVTYTIGFKPASSYTAQCVTIVFGTSASNGTKPTGMSTTANTKGTFTGLTDASWSSYSSAPDGTIQLEYSTGQAVTTGTTAVLPINNINNPTSADTTFYATITTYTTLTTHTCSGAQDTITVAWATTSNVTASVTVDPSLTFQVNGQSSGVTVSNGGSDQSSAGITTTSTTIPFGNMGPNSPKIAAQQLVVSTNASGGYTVYASYSAKLTDSQSHTIADHTGTNASPTTLTASTSTSKFGYTTASTTLSGTAGRFGGDKYAGFNSDLTGAEIAGNAASPGPVDSEATIVGFKINISNTQAAGTYTTTIGYVATPTY